MAAIKRRGFVLMFGSTLTGGYMQCPSGKRKSLRKPYLNFRRIEQLLSFFKLKCTVKRPYGKFRIFSVDQHRDFNLRCGLYLLDERR